MKPLLQVETVVEDDGWAAEALGALIETVAATAYREGDRSGRPAAVCVALACDAAVRDLNRRFRGIDKPTNVLSFPAAGSGAPVGESFLGDIVLARETVEREAAELGRPVEQHVAHLVAHGLLHLIGYDHASDRAAETMEALERTILAAHRIPDPYAEHVPAAEAAIHG